MCHRYRSRPDQESGIKVYETGMVFRKLRAER
jgi:hypothetical protein